MKKITIEFAQRHDIYGGPWAIVEVDPDGSRRTLMILDGEPVLAAGSTEIERLRERNERLSQELAQLGNQIVESAATPKAEWPSNERIGFLIDYWTAKLGSHQRWPEGQGLQAELMGLIYADTITALKQMHSAPPPSSPRENDIESFISGARWARMAMAGGNHTNDKLLDEDAAYFADTGGRIRCRARPVPPPMQRMRIAFQPSGRCLWHEDCPKSSSGVMREVQHEESRTLLECLHCGQHGYYPKGATGSVCVDVVGCSAQPPPEAPEDVIMGRGDGG